MHLTRHGSSSKNVVIKKLKSMSFGSQIRFVRGQDFEGHRNITNFLVQPRFTNFESAFYKFESSPRFTTSAKFESSPSDYDLLGIFWQGKYYYDKAMPMGCASSCRTFEMFSTALEWVAKKHLPKPNRVRVKRGNGKTETEKRKRKSGKKGKRRKSGKKGKRRKSGKKGKRREKGKRRKSGKKGKMRKKRVKGEKKGKRRKNMLFKLYD